jgi:hypothetical protein
MTKPDSVGIAYFQGPLLVTSLINAPPSKVLKSAF